MIARRGICVLAAAIALGACSGLGGEPEIVATVPPRLAPTTEATVSAAWQPDISNGARIFQERCTECHGDSGDGLGALVAAGSVERPLDMTDRRLVASKSPLGWFEVITEGRIEKLMPPWENALSVKERWDVTLYSYTLGYDEELLAAGERLWRERCADCELPGAIPPVFSEQAYGSIINREYFGGALTSLESDAATAYARLQSLESAAESSAWPGAAGGHTRSGAAWHGGRDCTGRHADSAALWQPGSGLHGG